MTTPNTNCLEGWECPACAHTGPFDVVATCSVKLYDDGTQDAREFDWADDAAVTCLECLHVGTVATFSGPDAARERMYRDQARAQYEHGKGGTVVIDETAEVAEESNTNGGPGAYVAAWVWVRADSLPHAASRGGG